MTDSDALDGPESTPERPDTSEAPRLASTLGEAGADPVVAAAAAERRTSPTSAQELADRADRYEAMMRLASIFDDSGEELRQRARLGPDIVADPTFTESVVLSPATAESAEEAVLTATGAQHGLLSRGIELDADALVLRATVLTYRWIDDLQAAAYETLGSIAGRAIGYLAPEVALGGAVVSAGLIETDALDRDGVAAYLGELAQANPELMEHVTSGGGGLLDGLQLRSVLTVGALAGDEGRHASRAGLRALGIAPLGVDFGSALRDVAGGLVEEAVVEPVRSGSGEEPPPQGLAELMERLTLVTTGVEVRRVGADRFIAYLPGPATGRPGHLRLVGGDLSAYATQAARSIAAAVAGSAEPRVLLVGTGQGGVAAAELAATPSGRSFLIDQVITAGSPSAHVPRIPEPTRVLSLEDRRDPVALLGSLINAGETNRVTVVVESLDDDLATGARTADSADHPGLRAELERIQRLGFLAG